jgi:hypothetical protein
MNDLDRPRVKKRKKKKKGSLAPLFWVLGIVVVLGAGGGVAALLWNNNRGAASTPEKREDVPSLPPLATAPLKLPTEAYQSVLPAAKGMDPLTLSPALQKSIQEMDRIDPDWRLPQIEARRPLLPPEQNGARHLIAVARMWQEEAESPLSKIKIYQSVAPDLPYPEADLSLLRKELPRRDKILAEARKLSQFPRGRFRLEYNLNSMDTQLPHVMEYRKVMKLLAQDAVVHTEDGDSEGAMVSCLAILHACRYLRDEPISITLLVIAASHGTVAPVLERVLARKKGPSDEALAAIQQALEEEGNSRLAVDMHRAERAGLHYLITNVANGDTVWAAFQKAGVRVSAEDHAWLLDFMTRVVTAAQAPPQQQAGLFAQAQAMLPQAPLSVKFLIPAYDKLNSAANTSSLQVWTAAVALAAERYRRQNGRWPENVEALRPNILKSLPPASSTHGTIVLKSCPEGFMVYYALGGNPVSFRTLNQNDQSGRGFRLLEERSRK